MREFRCRSSQRPVPSLQQFVDQADLFIIGLKLSISLQRARGSGKIIQTMIDQSEVVIDQGKVGLDLRSRFIMQAREREITRIIVKIGEIVVSFDVPR